MSNPKPCPFCGHAGEAAVNSDAVRCRWHVGWQPRVDWNARPIEDRLQLQLDAIRGLATGQPVSDPSSSDQGWSPALCAVKALVRERDEARDEAERLAKKGDVYREAWHVIESALDGAGGLSPKHSPEEARDFIRAVLAERDRLREALRALCLHADEWRANGWVPATGALDDAHAALGVKP